MNYPWVDEYLLKKTAVHKDFKAEWGWYRYQIGDKLFAAVCLDEEGKPYYITLKLAPANGDFYRQQYPDVVLRDMLDEAYDLVLHSFSKKRQAELLANEQHQSSARGAIRKEYWNETV